MSCPYYHPDKQHRYLRLLRYARIHDDHEDSETQLANSELLFNDLESLSSNFQSEIRPFLPLIYRKAVKTGVFSQLSLEAQSLLKNRALQLIATDLANKHCLAGQFPKFAKEKIPIILLKGAAFSNNLYPDNFPRIGCDIDFLVREDDFQKACTLMEETMRPVVIDSKRLATHETLFERVFTPRKGFGPPVEIHRGLTNPHIFNIDPQSMWEASRRHPEYDSEFIRILSSEDTLLHLAVHAFRDLDFCNHNLLDAHEVWLQWQPDHDKLIALAKDWGAQKVLYYLLSNCKTIIGTPCPEELFDSIAPGQNVDLINKRILQSQILRNARSSKSSSYRAIQLLGQMTFPDRIRQGIKYQLHYVQTRLKDLYTSA
ncbi:nucleotidyltransferase family protein [Desulfosediminicola sp.]|uniref:nucleotidyltransferase family protein n=1 Tax=Desulfosediminicola sp. TaxID=2886825 RepID=UPI003AF2ED87